jgi:hypothetical protein
MRLKISARRATHLFGHDCPPPAGVIADLRNLGQQSVLPGGAQEMQQVRQSFAE